MKKNILLKRLVLVGVGHSHLHLIQTLKKKTINNLEVVIISNCFYAPYSGTLPGYIAQHFDFEDSHIDLITLTNKKNFQFIHSSVKEIQAEEKTITLENGLNIFYDILSINIGSVPSVDITSSSKNIIPIKPIPQFTRKIEQMVEEAIKKNNLYRFAVLGGGVAAIESALAIEYRVRNEFRRNIKALEAFQISIFTHSQDILLELPKRVRNSFLKILKQREINIYRNKEIQNITENSLVCSEGEVFDIDKVLLCTSASSFDWIKKTTLKQDKKGFLLVNPFLQSLEYPNIFVSGDIASLENFSLPKAGVYSVKQGPILVKNIRNFLLKKKLKEYKPQKSFLKIISLGTTSAIFIWKKFAFQGFLAWWLKKIIDQNFLHQYKVRQYKKTFFF